MSRVDATLTAIEELVKAGVLSSERKDNIAYSRWPALRPGDIPAWLRGNYLTYGEIRIYWAHWRDS